MSMPAARIGDMHTCPMVTPGTPPVPHVGGPIVGPGAVTVLIGNVPAAVMGDMCTCVGPPSTIIKGSVGVMLCGKPAARVADSTAHGGFIVAGLPTVLIGELSPQVTALLNASALLAAKLQALQTWDEAAQKDVEKWFGEDTEAARVELIERITKAKALIDGMDESNFQPAEEGEEDCFAYVYPDDESHTIYLGDDFHTAPNTGTNSKAGTVVHEVSHFNDIAGTDDHVYGTEDAQGLASSPATADDAMDNADNFEYYMEH